MKKEDVMAEMSRAPLRPEAIDHPEGAEGNGTVPGEAQRLAGRFDPFHDPYLADPYPFLAEARAATPVFYSPDLGYWVVTRDHDIRHIFQTPRLFSAANTLAPLRPICPAAGRRQPAGGLTAARRRAGTATSAAATPAAGRGVSGRRSQRATLREWARGLREQPELPAAVHAVLWE
jgi:hypothetical protein